MDRKGGVSPFLISFPIGETMQGQSMNGPDLVRLFFIQAGEFHQLGYDLLAGLHGFFIVFRRQARNKAPDPLHGRRSPPG